ncbi:MAG: AAA family ATPase [Nannocystaceae bacterium]
MLERPQIHLTGASGAGVTTLGRALADHLECTALDTDDFYWRPTTPPFREKRPNDERLDLLRRAFADAPRGWVLSGSIGAWADPLLPLLRWVVYVTTPTEVRLARLRAREAATFGAENIAPGGAHHQEYVDFLEWAARYDHGDREGRSAPRHRAWLAELTCPVQHVDGTRPPAELAAEIAAAWRAASTAR